VGLQRLALRLVIPQFGPSFPCPLSTSSLGPVPCVQAEDAPPETSSFVVHVDSISTYEVSPWWPWVALLALVAPTLCPPCPFLHATLSAARSPDLSAIRLAQVISRALCSVLVLHWCACGMSSALSQLDAKTPDAWGLSSTLSQQEAQKKPREVPPSWQGGTSHRSSPAKA